MKIEEIVDLERHPLGNREFLREAKAELDSEGALVMPNFLQPGSVAKIRQEGAENRPKAFFCKQQHNVYLTPPDPDYPISHPRNREVISSKGCITDVEVPVSSPLRTLYHSDLFQDFLCSTLGEQALFPYADPLSSINIHYAQPGQELGWHFDNSSFAITLMIEEPEEGGAFEYVKSVRDADQGEMNFETVAQILDGDITPNQLSMKAGALVLFRGRNALHRVAPVEGAKTRMLVVLAYNTEPGIALSESARMTFYGRLE